MLKRILAALAVMACVLLGAQTPAQAAPANCPIGEDKTCLYAGANYTGTSLIYYVASEHCKSLYGLAINNNIESVYGTHSGWWIGYYNSQNCTGTPLFSSTSGAYPTLPASMRNVISSFKILDAP
jgi:hypothetical protein